MRSLVRYTKLGCLILFLSLGSAFAQSAGLPWIGTWGSALSSQSLQDLQQSVPNLTFSDQTVRQYVYTSIGGNAERLHFSNEYGTTPLTLQDVHLALCDGNGIVWPSTDVPVTFGGATSITIPAGGTVTSDAVQDTVPARGLVAISAYFPASNSVQMLSTHIFANQNGWYTAGDQSTVSHLPDPPQGTYPSGYFFLSGMDVQSPQAVGSFVALGASITDGQYSAINQNHRWENLLSIRLAAAGLNIGVLDKGIPGSNMLGDNQPLFGVSALHRYYRDVLSQAGVRWTTYSEFNDLNANPSSTLIAGLQTMMNEAHQNHIRFLCSTLTPYSLTGAQEANRQQYNAFIRSPENGCDAVIDQDAAVRDPNNPSSLAPQYIQPHDMIHPNDAGYQAIANAIPLSIFSEPTPLPAPNPSTSCSTGMGSTETLGLTTLMASCNRQFGAYLQVDGNFVVYNLAGKPVWASNMDGTSVAAAEMLPTGNFVLYAPNGQPVWATNTDGNPNSNLVLLNSGSLVVEQGSQVLWSSSGSGVTSR